MFVGWTLCKVHRLSGNRPNDIWSTCANYCR